MRNAGLAMLLALLFLGSLTVVAAFKSTGKGLYLPAHGTSSVARISIYNRIVDSESGTSEDPHAAYLSTKRIPLCADMVPSCKILGSEFVDGQVVTAICFAFGASMTNLNYKVLAARTNSERVSSTLWYGIVSPTGRLGYLAEVYVSPDSRGGRGLRAC